MRFLRGLVHREGASVGRKVIRNVVFSGVRLLVVAPVPFLMVPFILKRVGASVYGTWSVFLAIITLSSLADLGLAGTLSKHVAQYHARQDFTSFERLLNSGLVLYGFVAGVLLAGLAATSGPLTAFLFRDSVLPAHELQPLFGLALLVALVNLLTLPFASVLVGLQRLDVTTLLATVNVLLTAGLTCLLLSLGWQLPGLILASLASSVVTLVAHMWTLHRLVPQVQLNPLRAQTREMKDMLSFSVQIFVTQAAVTVHNQIEKVYLALLVGVVPAGWYEIASDVAAKVRAIPNLLLSPVMPAASELDAQGDTDKLRELYYRTHKYLALVGVPLVLFVAAFSVRFVELWIGPQFRVVAVPLALLVTVNYLNLVTGPGYLIFFGQGNLRPGVYSAAIGLAVNVVVSLALIYLLGFSGAIIGTSIALIVASTFFLLFFHRGTHWPAGILVREAYLKPLVCAVGILCCLAVLRPPNQLGWGGMCAQAAVFGTLYGAGLMLWRHFDAKDLAIAEQVFPGLRLPRRLFHIA